MRAVFGHITASALQDQSYRFPEHITADTINIIWPHFRLAWRV